MEPQSSEEACYLKAGYPLYDENINYRKLVEAELIIPLEVVTSYRFHPSLAELTDCISIHFRLHLEKLKGNLFEKGKHFIRGVEKDFGILAERLTASLPNATVIVGLTEELFKTWGEKHGFKTVLFTEDSELIVKHTVSIENDPHESKDRRNPLYVFWIRVDDFIERFGKGSALVPAFR